MSLGSLERIDVPYAGTRAGLCPHAKAKGRMETRWIAAQVGGGGMPRRVARQLRGAIPPTIGRDSGSNYRTSLPSPPSPTGCRRANAVPRPSCAPTRLSHRPHCRSASPHRRPKKLCPVCLRLSAHTADSLRLRVQLRLVRDETRELRLRTVIAIYLESIPDRVA